MIIKNGYNDKKTEIRIGNACRRVAEFWIEQTGLKDNKETLSYISLLELLDLKDEVDEAIKTIVRLEDIRNY